MTKSNQDRMFFLVKDPTALLGEIHRILRLDGLLILDDGHKSRKSTLEKLNQAGNWEIKEAGQDHLRCIPK